MNKRRSKIGCAAAVLLAMALFAAPSGAAAGGSGCGTVAPAAYADTLAVAGIGTATDMGAPCADLACNSGDTCDCTTENGRAHNSGSLHAESVSYELSVDESAAVDGGVAGGQCMPATGKGVITLKDKSTIDFAMSGLNCTVPGVAPHGLFNGTLRLGGGTAHRGKLHGLGSMQIGDTGGATTEAGATTPAESQYEEMWAQDAAAMYGYAGGAGGN